jgi:hypothetical protein
LRLGLHLSKYQKPFQNWHPRMRLSSRHIPTIHISPKLVSSNLNLSSNEWQLLYLYKELQQIMEVVQQIPRQILFSTQAYNILRDKWNYLKMCLCEVHMSPSSLPLFLVLESTRS